MISIEKFPAFNGNPPGVAVRFSYIEPTHEVAEALVKAGIETTRAFRAINLSESLVDGWWQKLTTDQIEQALDDEANHLLDRVAEEIFELQSKKLEPKVEA